MTYWDDRYASGGHSGAGSRGEAARVKAAAVNRLDVDTVLDIGCGDGQVARFIRQPGYLGVDPSRQALVLARASCPDKTFRLDVGLDIPPRDAHLSLDVIHHLLDDDQFDAHLRLLFSAQRFVVVAGTDRDEQGAPHVRHRRWTHLIQDPWTIDRVEDAGPDKRVWTLRCG